MRKKELKKGRGIRFVSYISQIREGVEADAVLIGVVDTVNRAGYNPLFEFVVRVLPGEGDPFETSFKRVVPAGMVPNFQLGRKFRIVYDPHDRSRVSFLSFQGENGETFDFRRFPVGFRNLGETEMKAGGA